MLFADGPRELAVLRLRTERDIFQAFGSEPEDVAVGVGDFHVQGPVFVGGAFEDFDLAIFADLVPDRDQD